MAATRNAGSKKAPKKGAKKAGKKKPARRGPRRPRQQASESLGAQKELVKINEAIDELLDAQKQRMDWGECEKERRAVLHNLLQKAGFKTGKGNGYKSGNFEAWIEVVEEKTKARKKVVGPEKGKDDLNF